MTREGICTYEVAKLAKEKGFDWECLYHYDCKGSLHQHYAYDATNSGVGVDDLLMYDGHLYTSECLAPSQSLLQRWLREMKGIHIVIESEPTTTTSSNMLFQWIINYNSDGECYDCYNDIRAYPSYEKTLESALKFALENLI